jgi:hypothetical protein
MFGALLRAAPDALFVALIGAFLAKVTGPFIGVMTSGSIQQSNQLVGWLSSVSDNAVLIGILGLVLTLLARAVVEAQVARV